MFSTKNDLVDGIAVAKDARADCNRRIFVSMGTCGIAAGTRPVLAAIHAATEGNDSVDVVETGCMGLCHSEPSIEVLEPTSGESRFYGPITVDEVPDLLAEGLPDKEIARSWYYPEYEEPSEDRPGARIVLRNSGRIDPTAIDDYLANDGFVALADVLGRLTPDEVVEVIRTAGLRGRGGGGFSTGEKWAIAAEQESPEKYIICNADEGDPGAFMDRAVLEGDPFVVIEAMTIAGYATGAGCGIIYIRAEYPLAIERLQAAIDQAGARGLLGQNILSSGFSFRLELKLGAGAFVCGEETALIRSIQGGRGMPVYKPPFPATSGLWGKPSVVNNVETLANIPAIIRRGAAWFKNIGTEGSPGTKVFSLTGKINKVGLIEVPMGISLRDIIFRLGDGIPEDKAFKAVQTGGPSGGCITAQHIDSPIDYESLKALHSMMGSGGMIVMDESDCMIDVARFFLEFAMEESCGKCTPCRVGTKQMHLLLSRITSGQGTDEDLRLLRDLAEALRTASLCGLGMTAANPVISTMSNFADEYQAHVKDKRCPAGRCRDLLRYGIEPEICIGCRRCATSCPVDCISGKSREPHVIDQDRCIRCGACFDICPVDAIIRS